MDEGRERDVKQRLTEMRNKERRVDEGEEI